MAYLCSTPKCPALLDKAGKCDTHRREYDKQRGYPEARGYGTTHREARKRWEPIVATGNTNCSRCGKPITKGQTWALDHDDNDRTKYRGPSHTGCNNSAGGKLSGPQKPIAAQPHQSPRAPF